MGTKFVRRMALLGAALLLITTLLFLPGQNFRKTRDAQEWVDHTLLVLHASSQTMSALEDAETNERGYLLTGDEHYLQPFQLARSNNLQARQTLRQLTVDNASQQVRIGKLDQMMEARLDGLRQMIDLYKTEGSKAAVAVISTGAGTRLMTQIRSLVSDIDQEEHRLLKIRTDVVETRSNSLLSTLRLGGLCLVILLTIFGVVSERDISSHLRDQESLKASEEQFHTLANSIPQLCWIAKADGELFWYNQRWYDFTGTTFEDMRGWGWQSVHDPAMLPVVVERWKESLRKEEPFEMVFPLKAADGTFHSFLTRVTPVRDQNGVLARWFGTNTDITEQRMTEIALRENQERLRLAQEVAQIGTFEWNLETGRRQRTPELEVMYGVQPGEFETTQRIWLDRVCPEDDKKVRQHMHEAMDTGVFEAEWRLLWPNGEERWHFGRARVLKDDAGQPSRVIGAIVDVTGRKHAELEVLRINADLEQRVQRRTVELNAANKELAAFAYSVSHDLRAPLRGIDGWSLALLEDYGTQLDDVGKQYLNRVRSETQRMGNLIDDMLKLSRVTRDEMKLDQVDLTKLATNISAELRNAQPERAIDFAIAPDLTVTGDGRLLEIALINLFSNAVKFTGKREKAFVEFGKSTNAGEVVYFVRDNGAGFDMAYAKTLFGAFQRLHKASEYPGIGIGLAIVQRVIGRHNGRVWAEAKVDHGATFWFTLGVYA